ncbi:Hybrid-cluster protein [Monocercomonoides exilis]|uniref:Hybrid-cluster protein n=1 Tax=Monocercomonoides exilis TaxID=2049356 RepID=UPI003559E60F|nr:Hybrid-cluster protein [Monocercomonoides exilis]|eukprot:MONOS_11732.1-p1 / transcript=MONOS_11732.1 / gene=MONOS_11732 / organism=Monocercomonoides_exilis_PA203 / gene_product=Hybrid-cluster protein / transcript_product=Hybrid-cluster protein / location=Mono_scaffold00606:8068-10215(-) / protein_length=672 / sequence_SO=supercontig / SO=protein_coding / is_pseudo=false
MQYDLHEKHQDACDLEDMPMFCYQCEQTIRPTGCVRVGVCSKNPLIAKKQDCIIEGIKCLSLFYMRATELGLNPPIGIPEHIAFSLFLTLTNTNFDPGQHDQCIIGIETLLQECKNLIARKAGTDASHVVIENEHAFWTPSWPEKKCRIDARRLKYGTTVVGLQEMIVYGLKGLSAYAYHAIRLGNPPTEVLNELPSVLAFIANDPTDVDELLKEAIHVGMLSHRTMEVLDHAHTKTFGAPVPTKIKWGPQPGKCILVSGHDLLNLKELLEQTEGKGINVYTHGEMMPCHGYPELNKYKHLVGHYGSAWQNQKKEFADFPGPILMTTNCIVPPTDAYRHRIWATGPVGFPGVEKIVPDREKSAPSAMGHEAEKRVCEERKVEKEIEHQKEMQRIAEGKADKSETVEDVAAKARSSPSIASSSAAPLTTFSSLPHTNFRKIIEQALSLPGFPDTVNQTVAPAHSEADISDLSHEIPSVPNHTELHEVTVGFAHESVVGMLPEIVNAIKEKKLRRIFVVGGCDGYEVNRSYFTELVRRIPSDCAVFTLACGRFRFNHLGLDQHFVPGTKIPRLMDCGQCNDSYSAVAIAAALAKEFGVDVVSLPLSVCLSWFEQKAVADLLALLAVGVRNIKIGPRPPAFLTEESIKLLNEKTGLTLTSDSPENDLKEMMVAA